MKSQFIKGVSDLNKKANETLILTNGSHPDELLLFIEGLVIAGNHINVLECQNFNMYSRDVIDDVINHQRIDKVIIFDEEIDKKVVREIFSELDVMSVIKIIYREDVEVDIIFSPTMKKVFIGW